MAINFDGVDDVVDHGDINAIDGASVLTISFWVYMNSLAGTWGLFGKAGSGSFFHDNNVGGDGTYRVGIGSATGHVTAMLANQTWTHAAMVFDGGGSANADRLKLYKDGVSQTVSFSGTIPSTIPDGGAAVFVIGRRTLTGTASNSRIGHVKLWTAALTAGELQAEMGTARPQRTANLLLWGTYDDSTSPRDYSGNGHNGTQTGGATLIDGPPTTYGGR
jgi:hypothetical protein